MTWQYFEDPRPDIQALVEPRGLRCLDIGCGAGALSAALKAAGAAHVAGIECDPRAAGLARDRLDDVIEGGILDVELPFADGEFDLLLFGDVLEHLPEPNAALARCLPLLCEGGRVVVSVPNFRFWLVLARLAVDRWAYSEHGVRDRTHLRIFTKRSLLRMLAHEGLVVEVLSRNKRLFDEQSNIGRLGAAATRAVVASLGRSPLRELLTYQYVVVARRGS